MTPEQVAQASVSGSMAGTVAALVLWWLTREAVYGIAVLVRYLVRRGRRATYRPSPRQVAL